MNISNVNLIRLQLRCNVRLRVHSSTPHSMVLEVLSSQAYVNHWGFETIPSFLPKKSRMQNFPQ